VNQSDNENESSPDLVSLTELVEKHKDTMKNKLSTAPLSSITLIPDDTKLVRRPKKRKFQEMNDSDDDVQESRAQEVSGQISNNSPEVKKEKQKKETQIAQQPPNKKRRIFEHSEHKSDSDLELNVNNPNEKSDESEAELSQNGTEEDNSELDDQNVSTPARRKQTERKTKKVNYKCEDNSQSEREEDSEFQAEESPDLEEEEYDPSED